MQLSSAYHKAVDPTNLMEIVDATATVIKKWIAENRLSITHIVATGSSGQAVAWPVSYKLGIPVCIVRKDGERSHAGRVTGTGVLGDYVMVDDLISSGETVRRVMRTLAEEASAPWNASSFGAPRCAGIFLYSAGGSRPRVFEDAPLVYVDWEKVAEPLLPPIGTMEYPKPPSWLLTP